MSLALRRKVLEPIMEATGKKDYCNGAAISLAVVKNIVDILTSTLH